MKKFYRIILLLIIFIFLSTYNPSKFDLIAKRGSDFFTVQDIEITNNLLISKNQVIEKLDSIYGKSIFFLKENDIQESIKDINFLKKVEVKKIYPNTVIVKIFETIPVGILFKNKEKYLLDNSSNLIPFNEEMNFSNLPDIFGEGAENNFMYFFNKLKNNNFPKHKIKKYYFFQVGRWDLELINNKIIKFPHQNTERAIKKSLELLDRKDFANYNIIDLRVDGKIIVE